MNLTELARRLRVSTKELKEKLPELGFDIGMKAIKVPDEMAHKIIAKWKEEERRQKIAAKYEQLKQEENKEEGQTGGDKVLKIPAKISVRDLADRLQLSPAAMIAELMKHGIMASLSERIDFEIATIVAEELGYKTELQTESDAELDKAKQLQDKLEKIKSVSHDKDAKPRPPVIVVLGHVDHGKTKLLDAIRETNVVEGEAGGITQHIGAYQVERKGKIITFIDTPGHEAFSNMRSRGAQVADIAILVVAADSGIQPQTIEAIKIIQDAGLPMIVAINKIDKPEADIDRVKKELAEINLVPEDWGGDVICVPVSAKEGTNLDELLDMILLVEEMNREKIKAKVDDLARGTIIESHLDKSRGAIATVLIHTGTLKVGDYVKVGSVVGKIRSMFDFKGRQVKTATPSTPVQIIGLAGVPEVGEILEVIEDIKSAKRDFAKKKKKTVEGEDLTPTEDADQSGVKKLPIILKADVVGSLEAIEESLKKFRNQFVAVEIISKGLGDITEVDVVRADGAKAKIYGFNTSATPHAFQVAKEKGIDIKIYKIIYELLDDVRANLEELLEPEILREFKGKAEVLAVFRGGKSGMIVGAKVKEGEIDDKCLVVVHRDNKIVGEGKVNELRIGPEQVRQVLSGQEFGLNYSGSIALQEGDLLEFFTEKEVKRTLDF